MGKNQKPKRPMNQRASAPSAGVDSPPSKPAVQASTPRISKAETAADGRGVVGGSRNDKIDPDKACVIHRDGVAYVEGCDIPVWRLEMSRRAGSGRDALMAAFPGLTSAGVDLAFAYARTHRAELDKLIPCQAAAAVLAGDEAPGDDAGFETDLGALFDANADVFRRLAQ